MIEITDRITGHKMMMLVIVGLNYQDNNYLVYAIGRERDEANIFVSKLVKGSLGYLIDDNFSNGEKEVLDKVIARILNKEDVNILENDGYILTKDIKMDDNLTFDIDKCYICTINKSILNDVLRYYNLKSEKILNKPIVEVKDDSIYSEGFASSVILIILGIISIIFILVVVLGII